MTLNTTHLVTTPRALEAAVVLYQRADDAADKVSREVYRMAIVKGLELTQEVCFKLLKRRLRDFGHSPRRLEATSIKDLLRLAAQHSLITLDETERWFAYRDKRNDTAHDYGERFAVETLPLLPKFLQDAGLLTSRLQPPTTP
jgi:nucleotidyltransferase substrate binding protein (TIGR01987 family)